MLCENCGENEANVKYTQIVNGVKKEMKVCDKCAKKMGIGMDSFGFNMPINLSNFFGEFLGDEQTNFLQGINNPNTLICDECNMSYEDFVNTGKFGCSNCYNVFENQIDLLLKNLQGSNRHVGRKLINNNKQKHKTSVTKNFKMEQNEVKEENGLEALKTKLKKAIQEERYEDAAELRDEIKKIENEK